MSHFKNLLYATILSALLNPATAYCDSFGGDLMFLAQIVTNTLDQLQKMQTLIGKYDEELKFVRDLNAGVKEVISIHDTVKYNLKPGVFSDVNSIQNMLFTVEDLYGRIPKTNDAPRQKATDQTVAEGIKSHNDAYQYAEAVDSEADRIKSSSRAASPQAAQKLTAQSLGVVVQVMNQLLRTNASILKVHSEELALKNRREKLESENTVTQYSGVASTLSAKPQYQLAHW